MHSIHATKPMLPAAVGVSLLLMLSAPLDLFAQQSWTEAAQVGEGAAPAREAAPVEAASANALPLPYSSSVKFYNNRTAFQALFPGLTLENFEDLDVGAGIACGGTAPLNASTNTPGCVSPGDIVQGFQLEVSGSGANTYAAIGAGHPVAGNPSKVIGPDAFVNNAIFRFTGPGGVHVVGFSMACPRNPGPMDILVVSSTVGLLANYQVAACGAFPGTFVGIASEFPIGLIAFTSVMANSGELFDDLVFGPLRDDVVLDFDNSGTWILKDNASYAMLHAESPEEIAIGDIDGNGRKDTILDFPGFGVWAWMNDTSWVQLHTSNVTALVTGDLDGNGQDDVLMAFPGGGIWVWLNNGSWFQLHTLTPTNMVTGDLDGNTQDEVIIDFPGAGLWVWLNNASWYQLHALNASVFTTADIDSPVMSAQADLVLIRSADVIVSFPGLGIWAWMNNTSWVQLHTQNASAVAVGDLTGTGRADLIFSFPGAGLWIRHVNGSWVQLHTLNPEQYLTADIDGSGQPDVIIDFGEPGLWAWMNNSGWVQLHTLSPQGMAAGDLDGR